ncbi:ATP-dependent DNA helicase [Bacillus sp. JRC01]|nr:ATP-dependent DNA helicase [Bacillus sp. JRC01]
MNLQQELKRHFGYETFRAGQEETITSILDGCDTLSMLPTGTGKSLCYQLPGQLLDGQVLIVSPLLSLMQDQVEQMKVNGEKSVIALNSFLTYQEKAWALDHIHRFKFIFVSPEMMKSEAFRTAASRIRVGLFVIDEAHCISQWGPDFRPDYLDLGEARERLGMPVTLALTATATRTVRDDIREVLRMEGAAELVHSVDRKNIGLFVRNVEDDRHKRDEVLSFVERLKGPGIIYFTSKRKAEDVALWLREHGVEGVAHYHGGMDHEERILIQQQFLSDKLQIICATSAFGMGVNKENVRFVVHYHLPSSIESYLQEIGRAGRDGRESVSLVLYAVQDASIPLQFMHSELPDDAQIEGAIAAFPSMEWSDIIAALQLSDVQSRFLEYYIQSFARYRSDRMVEEIKRIRDARIAYKRRNLDSVMGWLHTASCRRQVLLDYFGEELKDRPERCCDRCGSDLGEFHGEGVHSYPSHENWADQLKKILLGSVV